MNIGPGGALVDIGQKAYGLYKQATEPTPAPMTPTPEQAPAPEFYGSQSGLVAVHNADGTVDQVRQEDLPAVEAAGGRPASEAEYYGMKMGTTGQVAAGVLGAAQGLSFDFAVPAVLAGATLVGGDKTGEEYARALRITKEAFPGTYLGGEAAGALAPAFFGEPGQAEAKGEQALAGAGEGLLARAAARAGAAAPRAAIEGAAMGLGQQATEDALHNHQLVAENYIAAGTEGGALGVLLGGALAAGEGAVSDVAQRYGTGLRETLANAAEKEALKSAGARTNDFRKLGETVEEQAEETSRLGRRLMDEGLVSPGSTQKEIAEKLTQKLDESGEKLQAMRKILDEGSYRPSMREIAERFEREVVAADGITAEGKPGLQLERSLFGDKEASPALDVLERVQKKTGEFPDFEKLHAIRKEIEDEINYTGRSGARGQEALRSLRNIVEDEFTKAGDIAAEQIGKPGFAEAYRLEKSRWADLKTVHDMAGAEAAREAGRNTIGLSDMLAGHEAVSAMLSGHPLGMLLPALNVARKKYGNQLASFMLDKASKLGAVRNATEFVDTKLARGAKDFLEGRAGKAEATPRLTSDDVRAIRNSVSSPTALETTVGSRLGELYRSAPKVAIAAQATVMRAAAFLSREMPKEVGQPPAFGQAKEKPISDTALVRASREVETIKDPTIVLDRLKEGRLTRDHVRALREVYPETYGQIQEYIRTHAEELRPKLTVQQECQLAVLFDQPINASLTSNGVKAYQTLWAQMPGEQQPHQQGGAPPSGAPINIGKAGGTRATTWDQLEASQ